MISPAIFFLLGVLAAVCVAAAEVRLLENLAENCRFKLDGRSFDLCPIFEGNDGGWVMKKEMRTPPTVKTIEYRLDMKKPLKRKSGVPSHEQCPEGTFVCGIVSYERPKHPEEGTVTVEVIPVAGEIPYGEDGAQTSLRVSAQLSPDRLNKAHDILHVRLHGGWYVDRQQRADIQFRCDHRSTEPSEPTYYYSWNGTTVFSWPTKHACPTGTYTTTALPPDSTAPSEDDDAPPDDDEKELVDTDLSYRARRSTLLVLGSAAALVGIIFYSLQTRPKFLRAPIRAIAKAHPSLLRSRVGERVLVRWADELEMEGDEDVMVNGAMAMGYAQSRVVEDEQIPLKPSPRMGSGHYGSA